MFRVRFNSQKTELTLRAIAEAVRDEALRVPLERAAWRVHEGLVLATPSRTGITRRNWAVSSPLNDRMAIRVHNDNKVMLWLDKGTGWAGTPTSHDGFIFPKTKRWLYIPLRHGAMIWHPGLVLGKDFLLKRRVRGIKAMKIVEGFQPTAINYLREEMVLFLQAHIK